MNVNKKNENILTIIVGGDIEADYGEIFSGKPIKETKQSKNTLYLNSFEQLHRLLSPKKIDLLRYLAKAPISKKPKTVSEIAKELNRHQEAISRDIAHLKKLGLITTKNYKQTSQIIPKHAGIEIKIH